jgi:hypothetical protein
LIGGSGCGFSWSATADVAKTARTKAPASSERMFAIPFSMSEQRTPNHLLLKGDLFRIQCVSRVYDRKSPSRTSKA